MKNIVFICTYISAKEGKVKRGKSKGLTIKNPCQKQGLVLNQILDHRISFFFNSDSAKNSIVADISKNLF